MDYWKYRIDRHGIDKYYVVRAKEKTVGYFHIESSLEQIHIKEVVAISQVACETMLHEFYKFAKTNTAKMIVFHCPHQSIFGRCLRMNGAAEYSPYARRDTNLQMKILNLKGCLEMLGREFSKKLQQSELANMAGYYRIATEDDFAVLEINKGRVEVSEKLETYKEIYIPAKKIAQLISGFCVSKAIKECKGNEAEIRLIEVLFPPREPYFYIDDIKG